MLTAIILLFALAIFHFIYESILAPDLRLWLTLKLRRLRNEAIQLQLECAHTETESICRLLVESIDALIPALRRIGFTSLVYAQWESRNDPTFLERVRERTRLLDESAVPRIREIRTRTLDIAVKAVAVNSITWVVPWLLATSGSSVAKRQLRLLVSLNSREFQRILPRQSVLMTPT
jgi:hypothetical protein